jgi:hypothetical protein
MTAQVKSKSKEPRIVKTIREDIRNVKIKDDISGEYRELKEYFLSDERKDKLETMSKFKKFFVTPWWILKALYFKLTPVRRLLLLLGIILMLFAIRSSSVESGGVTVDFFGLSFFSALLFLFIIALELKDKLHAKTELEEGRAVQNALKPEENPAVKGWDIWLYTRPANDVGGDLLDFIKISESKCGISIGDVAGKGLSAALLMAKLQSTIRAIVPDYTSLSELGEKLNQIFCRDSLPRLFSSLTYIDINSESGLTKILNAGHIPPLIIRKGNIESLEKKSPALGIIPNCEFLEQEVTLNSGDTLFIYSDGLTEERNENGEFFGEERLKNILLHNSSLPSQNLGELVLSFVDQFKGTAKVHDDMTMIIAKVN